jgi:hypothetical protein
MLLAKVGALLGRGANEKGEVIEVAAEDDLFGVLIDRVEK